MSDGTWDGEYAMANDLKDEIIEFCNQHNLECPEFPTRPRTWDLHPIFDKLKKQVTEVK